MSYAIIRNAKYKMSNLTGISRHNERQNKEYGNKDIDASKSHLNFHLKVPIEKSYEKEFYRLKEENELKGNLRLTGKKQSNIACEFLVTSDKTFFDNLGKEGTRKFFETSYEFASKKCGEKNIISAVVHMDEATPHMHLTYIPVVKGMKKDQEINKVNCSEFWKGFNSYGQLQDSFHSYVTERGFNLERGEKTLDSEENRKHLTVQEFKSKTLLDKVKDLEEQKNTIKIDLNALEKDLNRVSSIKTRFHQIDSIEGKYGLLNKQKVTIDAEDFKKLKDMAKKHSVLERKIKILEKDNADMKSDISKFIKIKNKEFDKSHSLQTDLNKANKRLSSITEEFEIVVKFLDKIGQLDNVKDYLREQLDQKTEHKYKQQDFDLEK